MYVNMYRRVAKDSMCYSHFDIQKSGVLRNVVLFAFLPWIPTKLSLGEGPPQLISYKKVNQIYIALLGHSYSAF